ncbi:patatin-like phospholipase family protein [Actinocorallia longicatena]|uniref:Patatin-like phospholipase family protein n=1 Tax=Actinocorallia longicatena TaxID=111803 RepID=A0ABP6QDK5_9ACTN
MAGIGWEAGLITGLKAAGVDLTEADLIVGTSAGSVVGTVIAQNADLTELVDRVAVAEQAATGVQVDMDKVMTAFAIMYDRTLDRAEAKRRVGALALEITGGGERLAQIAERLPSQEWPERPLLITAVDTATGELRVWDAASGAGLAEAVSSSCCVPCVFPPVTIGGRRYMDGGVHSISNADLAKGADRVVVIEPMAHLTPRSVLKRELEALGEARIATIGPDAAAVEVFGVDVLDPSLWRPAFAAGLAQAPAVAADVAAAWSDS